MAGPATAQLIEAALGSPSHPLAGWYAALLAATPGLRDFTVAHASKIRKKVRHAGDSGAQRDLRCELAVAGLLAADRRSTLVYEPMAAHHRRGPDFLLRHKGHTALYVEVTRLRRTAAEAQDRSGKLAALVCGKLGQLVAGAANLLVIVSDSGRYSGEEVAGAVRLLRQRADAKDDAFFAFRGLASARELHQQLLLLGGVLVAAPATGHNDHWAQPAARRALPPDLVRALSAWNLAELVGAEADGEAGPP